MDIYTVLSLMSTHRYGYAHGDPYPVIHGNSGIWRWSQFPQPVSGACVRGL